jgi:hypothetical protein
MKMYRITYTVQCEEIVFEDEENFEDRMRFAVCDEDTQMASVEEEVRTGNYMLVKAAEITEEDEG